ncbi:MAG: transglycosylase SLT domain-containing protein [Acidobacteriia bacterium]|nr:transglycosylase SLT domain-containing protein [Terriglobia bacterium]
MRGRLRALCFLLAVLALVSCGTTARRRVSIKPPSPAYAPAELPIRSLDAIIRAPQPPPPDPIDQLIAQAEQFYATGVENYGAGNPDKARQAFDEALALLLQSKTDLASNERLRNEFEKLVENIHSLEVAAVERGDVLSEQRYEPAPIESFSGLTFPVDPKVRERVQQEIGTVRSDLPLVSNDIVDGVITYLKGRGAGYTKTALTRLGRYQPLFADVLRKQGLPQDLVYLAAAESAFNPFALSRVGAKGIWQLMLSRAIEYGLKRDRWVDEREDPVKSTQVAVRHLKDLYEMFGDWYLAMAAYNCGPVAVQRAIEKTGYADFWTLYKLHALPVDTENYVPVIIATALIAKDPKAYGFEIDPDPPLQTDEVVVGAPTDLRLVAQIIDHPVEELIRLNPGLLRWTTPANDPEYVLRLPAGTKGVYEGAIALIPPDKRIWWRAHKVAEGETLSSVARKFRVTPVALAGVNNLAPGASLEEGARLVLPLAPGNESSLARVRERGPRRLIRYRVKAGDTLDRVADRFDVTPYQIRRWNKLQSPKIAAGRSLRTYVAGGAGAGSGASRSRRTRSSSFSRQPKRKTTQASRSPARSKTPSGAEAPGSVASR